MTKSNITKLFTAESVVENATGVEIFPQRIADEIGAWQLAFNQDPDPGGGSTGAIVIEGKVSFEATYVPISTKQINDFDGLSGATNLSTVLTDLSILPYMRVKMLDTGAGFSVAGGTTVDVWLME